MHSQNGVVDWIPVARFPQSNVDCEKKSLNHNIHVKFKPKTSWLLLKGNKIFVFNY